MPKNIEIKSKIVAFEKTRRIAVSLSDVKEQILHQTDTFFNVSKGRLKLREFGDGNGELIYYERQDSEGPKQSNYFIVPTQQPKALAETLSKALGIKGIVRKKRLLFLKGPTRIHLDIVEGLGEFLELEVVMNDAMTPAEGVTIAEELMRALGIQPNHLIDRAYIDLLLEKNRSRAKGGALYRQASARRLYEW
jgi:predicted adenylyl cyclase CyaB